MTQAHTPDLEPDEIEAIAASKVRWSVTLGQATLDKFSHIQDADLDTMRWCFALGWLAHKRTKSRAPKRAKKGNL